MVNWGTVAEVLLARPLPPALGGPLTLCLGASGWGLLRPAEILAVLSPTKPLLSTAALKCRSGEGWGNSVIPRNRSQDHGVISILILSYFTNQAEWCPAETVAACG